MIKVSRSADMAIRMLVYLASEGRPYTMPVLSEKLGIPYHNLTKLVQSLSRNGIVQTRQGKVGGISLISDPKTTSLRQVVDVIDGPARLAECLTVEGDCPVECGCKLKKVFSKLQTSIESMFEDVKLSQLV